MAEGISGKYGRLWRAIAEELTAAAADYLTRAWSNDPELSSRRKQWRRDAHEWIVSAERPIQDWLKSAGEDPSSLEVLRSLPPLAEFAPLHDFFMLVPSCSLFRLQPYRRTIIWEQHYNKLVPESFVKNFVIGRKSDLTAGETAFAAFASDYPDFAEGLVVADARRNLRGTYSLIDRMLGIRNNAFVPIRDREFRGAGDSLLAMVVVSLPIPSLFFADSFRIFGDVVRKYEELFGFLVQIDQREERVSLHEKHLSATGDATVFLKLLLDGKSPSKPEVEDRRVSVTTGPSLPACAVVRCENRSGTVSYKTAVIQMSPGHEARFLLTGAELASYGVNQEAELAWRNHLVRGAHVGRLRLCADSAITYDVPLSGRRLLASLDAIARDAAVAFEGDAHTSARTHLELEILRSLSQFLLTFVATGDEEARNELSLQLQLLSGRRRTSFLRDMEALRRWCAAHVNSARYLVLALDRPVLKGRGFLSSVRDRSDVAILSGGVVPYTGSELAYRLLLEFHDPNSLVSLCRALTCLIDALPRNGTLELEARDGFLLAPSAAHIGAGSVLTSLLFTNGVKLSIRRKKDAVTASIESLGDRIKFTWAWSRALLPLAFAILPSKVGGEQAYVKSVQLNGTSRGPWPSERSLFCDFDRLHPEADTADPGSWKFEAIQTQKDAAETLVKLAAVQPEFCRAVDSIAIVPLPTETSEELPTLSNWVESRGEQWLLVAASLRRPRAILSHADGVHARSQLFSQKWSALATCYDKRPSDPLASRFWDLIADLHQFELFRQFRIRDQASQAILHDYLHDFEPLVRQLAKQIEEAYLNGDTIPPSIAAACRRLIQIDDAVAGLTRVDLTDAGITYRHLRYHLPHGICDGRIRAILQNEARNLAIGRSDIARALIDRVAGTQSNATHAGLVKLLANILANAALSAARLQATVTITSRAPNIYVRNPASKETWEHAAAVINGHAAPGKDENGLAAIMRFVKLFHLQIKARTHNVRGSTCTAEITLSPEVRE
jgi:hypothetical protein